LLPDQIGQPGHGVAEACIEGFLGERGQPGPVGPAGDRLEGVAERIGQNQAQQDERARNVPFPAQGAIPASGLVEIGGQSAHEPCPLLLAGAREDGIREW